jgi:hypothetical protein
VVSGREVYGESFFALMGSCREAYYRLGDCIADVVGPVRDAIDFGCGLGFVLESFAARGSIVLGVDRYSGSRSDLIIVPWSLTQPWIGIPRDVAICTETGEHLPAEAADTLVESVSTSARNHIVWSAAPPGQDADDPGHINLQPPDYWLDKFAARGWRVDIDRTHRLRDLMHERDAQHRYCSANFYVLVPA